MSWKLDFESRGEPAERSFCLPQKLLVGAGPSNCSERVLRALSLQTMSPLNTELYEIMDDIQSSLKYVFQTRNPLTFVQQTSGLGGIETIITNLLEQGENIIVAVGGAWGEKTIHIAKRYKVNVTRLEVPRGEVFSSEELEKEIIKVKPVALFITQGESSVGTCQPLNNIGEICQRHNCLFVVDAVVSFGGVPLYVDRWRIDAIIGGSQKAVAAPPGMCFLTFSERAVNRMRSRNTPTPYYFDVLGLSESWNCFGKIRNYHYTYNANMLYAAKEALAIIVEEGLEKRWLRHKKCAERLWKGLENLGFKIVVPSEENRLWTVICAKLPEGIQLFSLVHYLDEKYDTQMSPGIGPTGNQGIIRIGTMGFNARNAVVDYVLKVLNDSITYLRNNKMNSDVFVLKADF